MKIRGSRRLIKGLGLALAAAALAAPSAQAVLPADGYEALGSSQSRLYADDFHAPIPGSAVSVQSRLYADDLHAQVTSSPVSVQSRLYADDLHAQVTSSPVKDEPTGYAPINTLARPEGPQVGSNVMRESSTFDSNDAVIGASVMFVLLGFGATILVVRQTRRSRPAAV